MRVELALDLRLRRLVALQHTSIDVYAYAGCRIKIILSTALLGADLTSDIRSECAPYQGVRVRLGFTIRRLACATRAADRKKYGERLKLRCACIFLQRTLLGFSPYADTGGTLESAAPTREKQHSRGRDGMLEESESQQLRDRP